MPAGHAAVFAATASLASLVVWRRLHGRHVTQARAKAVWAARDRLVTCDGSCSERLAALLSSHRSGDGQAGAVDGKDWLDAVDMDMLRGIRMPNTQAMLISHREGLMEMADALWASPVVGVDVEQHSTRSYRGFVCLLQLSTPTHTWVVDVLRISPAAVRHALAPVFENPAIVKVLHACSNDVLWLQRDFDLHLVNVFDTAEAAKALGQTNVGLHELLLKYCNTTMSAETKRAFQKADWRLRPLSAERLEYAASDARYLPYLYAQMTIMLAAASMSGLRDVRLKSNEVASRMHHGAAVKRAQPHASSWRKVSQKKDLHTAVHTAILAWCRKNHSKFAGTTLSRAPKSLLLSVERAFAAVHDWRDALAQQHDESPDYVLAPASMLEAAVMAVVDSHEAGMRVCHHALPLAPTADQWKALLAALKDPPVIQPPQPAPPKATSLLAAGAADADGQLTLAAQRELLEEQRRAASYERFAAKSPVYDNCTLLAPDGTPLCKCHMKKLQWYVMKGLGEWVAPNQVRLNFEPSGQPQTTGDDSFYVASKVNQCVVCGSRDKYLRFHIVPRVYRRHMPEKLKSHRSHDVVLLCSHCHEVAGAKFQILKNIIAQETGIPLNMQSASVLRASTLQHIRKGASTLRRFRDQLPEARLALVKGELIRNLKEVYDVVVDWLPEEELIHDWAQCESVEWPSMALMRLLEHLKPPPSGIATEDVHGRHVMAKLAAEGQLEPFILRWRVFFMEHLQPKFMPPGWHINHQLTRTFGENSRFATATDKVSMYRGVQGTPDGRWAATIHVSGEHKVIGEYDTEEEAARAYDAAARAAYREGAITNF